MKTFKIILISCLLPVICGCVSFTRTVYVPHGQAVRLREEVKEAKVWVKTADGDTVAGEMDIPEGWYCLPKD